MNRRRGGFTLVEMIVALATSSIVVLAGMSFVMMCLRVQSVAYADVSRQDTARVALTLVETLAERGELKPPDDSVPDDSVVIAATGDNVVLYSQDDNIYVGSKPDGTLLMSNAKLSTEVNDRLFTVTLKDMDNDGAEYSTTVFCRDWPRQPGPYLLNKTEIFGPVITKEEENRFELLKTAVGQFGSNGYILNDDGEPTTETFAGWYNEDWGSGTPWCACFVSWCIEQEKDKIVSYNEVEFRFADVNVGWTDETKAYFGNETDDPTPGDLIFFDLNGSDGIADHVGFVLRVEGEKIYTVEGNNNKKVVIAEYKIGGPGILGYAKLPWEPGAGG